MSTPNERRPNKARNMGAAQPKIQTDVGFNAATRDGRVAAASLKSAIEGLELRLAPTDQFTKLSNITESQNTCFCVAVAVEL